MPKTTQLNLPLQNEIGTLARLCRDLANGGVNVLALSAPESDEAGGMIRLLVANRELATAALSKAGYKFDIDEVIFVELKNRPGALAKAVEKLARAMINVRYAYVTTYPLARKAAAVIAVGPQDLNRAVALLG
jgi:hypothetical protein